MKDWRGTPIVVGSQVVYPSRQGARLWMNEGEVTSLKPFSVKKKGARRISHPASDRVTVLSQPNISA